MSEAKDSVFFRRAYDKFILRFFNINRILPINDRLGEIPDSKSSVNYYMQIAMPAAMQGLLFEMMMAIDLAMVGSLGASALAEVGIMGQPKMLLLVFARAISVPITALVARRYGEENIHGMNKVLKQGIMLNTLVYIPMLLAAYIWIKPLLLLAGATEPILQTASEYGRAITVGLFFAAFAQIVGAALIGTGNTKMVFRANVIGNIVNTGMNFFLIYGIGPFPRLEVFGAGVATAIGNLVTAVLILAVVWNRQGSKLSVCGQESWAFDRNTVGAVAKLGASSLGEQSFERFGMFVYTKMVAGLGVVPLATHYVCMNLCNLAYSFSIGLGNAGASCTGQYLGKNRPDLAVAFGKLAARIGFSLSAIGFAIYIVFRRYLIDLYTNDVQVLELGMVIILILAVATFPQTFQLVYSGVLKGAGDNAYVMFYSLAIIAVFRPIFTYFLCFMLNFGLYGAWFALLCDQTLRMCFAYFRFKGGKWKTIKI